MKWWKHRNGTISIIHDLDISLSIGDCRERERMSIYEIVKTLKWYYLSNTRSAYFPIDCIFLSMISSDLWWRGVRSAKLELICTTRCQSLGGRSASRSRDRSAKFELIYTTGCQSQGVDLPKLNSSWPLDVSTGGIDLPADLPKLNSSWPQDVSTGG